MIAFSSQRRHAAIQRLQDSTLDVLVIGGGIVGAGVARDGALRGLRVGLVEARDFAYGTSSRSSRLLHGGLRYLEQGRIGLVREASKEKKTIARIAPHLTTPLGFIFPTFRGAGRPLWQLKIGVRIYDLLCGGRNFQPSRGFSAAETHALLPALASDRLAGAVRYFDALTSDARLVIDTLRSAEIAGGIVVNYLRFADAQRNRGEWTCSLTDASSGAALSVRARSIVNATGPWAAQVPHSAVKLRLTKGIHLVVDRDRLPVPSAVVMTQGKRLLFVLPWGERIIIGTTDTDYEGRPEDVKSETGDLAYLLETVNEFFPGIALRARDVISTWAGVRPLIAEPDGSPSDISRAHQIRSPQPGWWDVAGGKLTTYRLMAEQTVDRIARALERDGLRSSTAEQPLLREGPDTRFSAVVPPACTVEAVTHYVKNEWAVHLDDVLLRRSGWHYYHADSGLAERVASWMETLLEWTPQQRDEELAAYRAAVDCPTPGTADSPRR